MIIGFKYVMFSPSAFYSLCLFFLTNFIIICENSVPNAGLNLDGQRVPAAGGDRAWAARTVSGPMWMCGDIFAAARLWRGRLLTTESLMMMIHFLFLQKQNLASGIYLFGFCTRLLSLAAIQLSNEMGTVRCCPL